MIAGVCAGLAERLGWTPTQVRLLAVLSCLLPGPQILAYVALWILMPDRPAGPQPSPHAATVSAAGGSSA